MIRRLSHFLLCLAIALLVVKPAFLPVATSRSIRRGLSIPERRTNCSPVFPWISITVWKKPCSTVSLCISKRKSRLFARELSGLMTYRYRNQGRLVFPTMVLTRQYSISIPGTLQRNYSSLEDALSAIRYPPRWTIADSSDLEAGEKYDVGVRIMLDVSQLPKPFQINALNNRDWRLSSDWKWFSYRP